MEPVHDHTFTLAKRFGATKAGQTSAGRSLNDEFHMSRKRSLIPEEEADRLKVLAEVDLYLAVPVTPLLCFPVQRNPLTTSHHHWSLPVYRIPHEKNVFATPTVHQYPVVATSLEPIFAAFATG
jgi:hypothetical protein